MATAATRKRNRVRNGVAKSKAVSGGESIRLYELRRSHTADNPDDNWRSTVSLSPTLRKAEAHRRRVEKWEEMTKTKLASHLIKPVELRFPGNRFVSITFDRPSDFSPRHALDVFPFRPDSYQTTVTTEDFVLPAEFTDRESALKLAAKRNLAAIKSDSPKEWEIVFEIGERFHSIELVNVDLIGDYGTLEMHSPYAIRVVRPTAGELERFAGHKAGSTKGGAV